MRKLTPKMKEMQFKKGETGNPNGRPPISKELRAVREITLDAYREVIDRILTGTVEELKEFAKDPTTPVLQVGVASAILHAIRKGDAAVIEQFAARLVGKIPDVIKLDSMNTHKHTVSREVLELEDIEVEAKLKRIRARVTRPG